MSLDVHLPDSPRTHALSIILWFHGGGLLQGSRKTAPPHLLRGVENQEYCLISADYRLAPQASVADIVDDALDALRFVRRQLSFRLDANAIHANDIAVSGSSAGGYLALLLALRDSKLRSCLAIYPITDPLGDFFVTSQPTPAYEKAQVQPFLDENAPVMSCNDPSSARNKMYFDMMASANLAQLLKLKQSQMGDSSRYIVAAEVESLTEGQKVCPIYMVHGNADRFVGIEQAYVVRDALNAKGMSNVFDEVDGADHSFDTDPSITMDNMYEFARRHWQYKSPQKKDSEGSTAWTESASGTRELRKSTSTSSLASTTSSTSTHHSIDITSDSSSTISSSSFSDTSDAEDHWAAQLHELSLVLNLVFLPLAGKYFGRQFAFWGWSKYMTWRQAYTVVRDKGIQRLSSVVVAGLS
ncbi:protein of unknown function [Taphrina deformans PYCC 5710]|uniref:BD-FAE-like domain-containing protein n=1 Tax=Taphrina deformans (strain PYCC 5710 / ATCC 11124 / CBS 356.35 / IMI 108563 / JCM 9778 / NBRC 8474) TaxID=1097556 RepID=R4XIZ0_TAPDE|nr:protein of unknown function [Taphrina deformans PYCC 5710]|eukprot:CCG83333.1 protein of unknown function [Taphrina deformans PYCC 5710]